MRTLYLHIGAHRTATSSIQAYLHANNPALVRQGILYPFGVQRHVVLMNRLFLGIRAVDEVCDDLEARADNKPGEIDTIILSDEDICTNRNLSILGDFCSRFRVKVIFSLRRQDLWLESWYLQNVKWQWNSDLCHLSWPDFLDRRHEFHWIDYHRYVAHLDSVFGADSVIPMVFEREQMPEGPVDAFCKIVGIDIHRMNSAPAHVNSSPSPLMAEFMRRLPLDEALPQYRGQLERACLAVDKRLQKSPGESSALLFDTDSRREILAAYEDGNRALAQRFFQRDVLFVEPVPPETAVIAERKLPDESAELIERMVAPFLRELINSNREAAKNEQTVR